MKLQQLEIHNIASIEDATIDFEGQPLADSEVFLITGKTGAGKSTILDAICLALYATTPRLDNTLMQGDTKDQEKEIKIKDPVQLMRRNTGEAHVVLTFTGSNGVHYEATWSVARARNKVMGKIQGKKWSLRNLDTDFTYTKDKEIRDEIATAIGLDFKQFCRTTLLAQGEFTRFLNSKDDDKAEILEKITGVDAYSKIGAKIFEKTAEKRKAWEDALQSIEGIDVMSEEMVESKNEEIKLLDEQGQQLKGKIDKLAHISQCLKNIEQSKQDILYQEDILKELQRCYQNLLGAQAFEKEKQDEIVQKIKKIDEFLDTEKSKVSIYDHAQTIVSNLRNIAHFRQQIDKNLSAANKLSIELEEKYKPLLASEQETLSIKRKEYQEFTAHLQEKIAAYDAINATALRHCNEELTMLLSDITNTKTLLSVYNEKSTQCAESEKDLILQKSQIEDKQKKLSDISALTHDAEIRKEAQKDIYEKQRESINKWAKSIRLHLNVGDICPVCQQKVQSTLPHEDAIDALVCQAEKLFKEAEAKHHELANKKNALEAEIKASQENYDKASRAVERAKANLLRDKEKLQETKDNCLSKMKQELSLEIENDNDKDKPLHDASLLDKGEQLAKMQLAELATKIKQAEVQEKEIKTMQAQAESLRKAGEKQRDKVDEAQKQFDKCQQQITVHRSLIESQTQDKKKAELAVSEWIKLPDSPLDYAVQLESATTLYHQQKEEKQTISALHEKYVVGNEHVATAMTAILDLMPGWGNYTDIKPAHTDQLLTKISELQSKVAAALAQMKSAKEKLAENQEQWEHFAEGQEEQTVSDDTLSLEATASSIPTKLAELETSQKALSEKRGGIISDLKRNQENLQKVGILIAEADKKKAEYEKWSRLNQLLGDATGNKFRRIAQSYVLASLIHSANGYMRTLSDRYILKVVPGSFVITMEDAYQGYASRAASTLSGGESFLVSLSLALALSDIGNQLSVDTLFIDEGFGTLSGEPLQHAIDTLRSLHSKSGRHVGIISHVEELKERIPVQIRVNQEGNNSSSTIEIVG